MKRLLTICAVVVLVVMNSTPAIGVITMDFEGMSDGQALGTYYLGVTFQSGTSGQDWVAGDSTTNKYNTRSTNGSSWNAATYWHHGNVFAWADVPGDDGYIYFDNQDATYVELDYCAASTLYLTAYDSGGNVIDTDNGPGNLWPGNTVGPGTLRVDWDGTNTIAYVYLHDVGNYWCVDDIKTDASDISIIPAPGAILLGSIGVGLVGWLRRRRTL